MKFTIFSALLKLIGATIVIAGTLGGIYVGAWVMFIGGIVTIITQIQTVVVPLTIAIAITKIVLASPVGVFIFWASFIGGGFIYALGNEVK